MEYENTALDVFFHHLSSGSGFQFFTRSVVCGDPLVLSRNCELQQLVRTFMDPGKDLILDVNVKFYIDKCPSSFKKRGRSFPIVAWRRWRWKR